MYLKELGSLGLYGYCAPERAAPGTPKFLATGYCVLDNDFARSQFAAPPLDSLRVTAAHEFFHAIQFAYDAGEDGWFMEATATWMEERYADEVDDNRQFLPFGQLGRPASVLDVFKRSGWNQYGNWAFFEYLSNRYGVDLVRSIWNGAAAFEGAPDRFSTRAVAVELRAHGGLPAVFARYAAGNTVPERVYPEGSAWPRAATAADWTLSARRTDALDDVPDRPPVLAQHEDRAGVHPRRAELAGPDRRRRARPAVPPRGAPRHPAPGRAGDDEAAAARPHGTRRGHAGLQQQHGAQRDDHARQRVGPVRLLGPDGPLLPGQVARRQPGARPRGQGLPELTSSPRVPRGARGRSGAVDAQEMTASIVFFSAPGCEGRVGAVLRASIISAPRSWRAFRPRPSRTFGNQSVSSSSMW